MIVGGTKEFLMLRRMLIKGMSSMFLAAYALVLSGISLKMY